MRVGLKVGRLFGEGRWGEGRSEEDAEYKKIVNVEEWREEVDRGMQLEGAEDLLITIRIRKAEK